MKSWVQYFLGRLQKVNKYFNCSFKENKLEGNFVNLGGESFIQGLQIKKFNTLAIRMERKFI